MLHGIQEHWVLFDVDGECAVVLYRIYYLVLHKPFQLVGLKTKELDIVVVVVPGVVVVVMVVAVMVMVVVVNF